MRAMAPELLNASTSRQAFVSQAHTNAKDAFRQTMLGSKGDLVIFWPNPLVASITTLAIALLAWPLASKFLFSRLRSEE